MPAITHSKTGDVAVIAVDTGPALTFLCHSLAAGTAFSDYPALVLDVRRVEPIQPKAQQTIDDTIRSCLRRQQWLEIVRPGEDTAHAVTRARRWQRVMRGGTGSTITPLRVAGDTFVTLWHGASSALRRVALNHGRLSH